MKQRVEPWRLAILVPAKCLLLAAGVDVQHNRLECYVWGWGRDLESWLIDRIVIFGSPALDATWTALEDLLAKGYPHAGGASLRLTAMAIDAGDGVTTHFVRAFARKWAYSRRVIAVKGQSIAGRALIGKPTKQDVNFRGDVIKKGVELWQYGADTAKGALYARLKLDRPKTVDGKNDLVRAAAGGIAGYVHLPGGLPDDFFDQLTAERRITRYLRGQPRVEWVLEKGRRNEALDCAGMAHAAAEYAGLSRVNWDALERLINPGQRDLFAAVATNGIHPRAQHAPEAAGGELSPPAQGAAAAVSPPAPVQTSALPGGRPAGRRVRGGLSH